MKVRPCWLKSSTYLSLDGVCLLNKQPRSGTFESKPHVTSITLNHESSPIFFVVAVLSLGNIISSFKQLLKRQLFCPSTQETVSFKQVAVESVYCIGCTQEDEGIVDLWRHQYSNIIKESTCASQMNSEDVLNHSNYTLPRIKCFLWGYWKKMHRFFQGLYQRNMPKNQDGMILMLKKYIIKFTVKKLTEIVYHITKISFWTFIICCDSHLKNRWWSKSHRKNPCSSQAFPQTEVNTTYIEGVRSYTQIWNNHGNIWH